MQEELRTRALFDVGIVFREAGDVLIGGLLRDALFLAAGFCPEGELDPSL